MARMRSTLSLTLIMAITTSALPVTAQERTATAGPLARAVTREAVRLAADATSPVAEAAQAGNRSGSSDWSRVRKLAPGTEIIVTVKGSPPGHRYFVAGDQYDLTVLNIADPALPPVVRDVLRDVASNHPDYFSAAQQGGQFVLPKNVRMVPDGVSVADRKVADLEQVVRNIARTDVAEIRGPVPYSPAPDALVGLGVEAVTGGGIGLVLCNAFGHCGADDAPLVLGEAALMGGVSAGISVAAGAAKHALHKTERVIYRAP